MRYATSKGRRFSPPTRDLLHVAHRIRCWRIAGERLTTAENLMVELDRLAEAYPGHVRRVEHMRSHLMNAILDSVISIPAGAA